MGLEQMMQLDVRNPKLWEGVKPSEMWTRHRDALMERASALVRGEVPRPEDVARRNDSDLRPAAEAERL